MDRNDTKLPRLDYLVSILTILIEEAIIRGGAESAFPDDLLDRFLELDNIIYQLGVMSPRDDPAFFAAQFRDYIRLFNGVFWYGDITVRNNMVKRQLVLEKGYERITQWTNIIPVHFCLILRPSRFIEIFLRASSWSEKIKPDVLMQSMLDQASELHKPQFLYTFAEAEANSQHFTKAKEHLAKMFSEEYEIHLDEDLKNMGQYMLQSIQLEEVGILLGVSRELRIGDTMTVVMDNGAVNFSATAGIAILGLAIFGDVLESRHSISDGIIQINSWKYDDPFWASPASGEYSGHRMDVVIIATTFQSKLLHLIFEGKTQQIHNNQLLPSELLLLRATSFEVEESELIQLMADILEGLHKADIVGLKSEYP